MPRNRTAAPNVPAEPGRRRRSEVDPRQAKHFDGSASWAKLGNPQPGFKYVWAYEGCNDTGYGKYKSLGYEEVVCPKNPKEGVMPGGRVADRPGEPYRDRGNVLMSLPLADWEDIAERGEDGQTGHAHTRTLEERIQNRGMDSLDMSKALKAGHLVSRPLEGDD